jgi:selenoprotein W-related protein
LLEAFEHDISKLEIVPSKGGVFEVEVDGDLVSSKKATGRHASYEEILASVKSRAGQ